MRLLHVIPSVDPRLGGPIEGVRRIAEFNAIRGHATEVVCTDEPNQPFHKGTPFVVHAVGKGKFKYSFNPRLSQWLRENHRSFDAVIVNGLWQYHSFATWRVLRGSSVPYYVFPHGMLDPWFKARYPLKHLKKLLYWPWAEYRVLRDATAVLFTCEEERRLARESFSLYRCKEIVTGYGTAPAPADQESCRTAFFEAFPQLQGRRIFLFLSRIHEKKGCDLLVEAFADVCRSDEKLILVMAGPGAPDILDTLAERTRRRGIADRVVWTGMLQGSLKWGALFAAEAFCLPSHQENFGIAVAEALGAGTPVLISNRVNIWREINAAGGGFVSDDTLDGTRENLKKWLACSPDVIDKMGRAARHCFETNFRVDTVAQKLTDIIADASLASSRSVGARN